MKCAFIIFVSCCITLTVAMDDNNFTFTYTMAMRCKEHLCQHGYSYDTFYQVDLSNRKLANGAELEMHIAILAASNGHILLSTIPHPEASDPVYEIVDLSNHKQAKGAELEIHIAILAASNGLILLSTIPHPEASNHIYDIVVGGGANKFTELRRNLRRNAKTSAKTIGILSSIEFRAFYIRISEDGDIEFGREGDALPILSYNDINPISVKYFSFAAWNGVEAKFLYDCPAPGENGNQTTPDSQEVEPKLSNSDQLKRTLLLDRQPNLPPGPTVNVRLGVRTTSVKYDALEGKLSTGLAIVTSWTDDSMAWNPNKFNGTTSLKFRQGQIWRPTFFVFNSDDMGVVDTRNPDLISMVNSGEATFHFQTKLTTWCSDDSDSLNRWPHDEYSCSIIIGPWEAHERLTLELMSNNDEKMQIFSVIDDVVRNEWDVAIKRGIVSVGLWNQVFTSQDNQTNQSDRLVMHIALRRRATSYNIVFYTPLLVLVTFVLLSFWSDRLQMSRVWFYAGATIVICTGLCFIDILVPCHTVPSVLILYTTVLSGILLALVLQIVLMTSIVEKMCKTVSMQSLLTSKCFRIVFCLPVMKTCRHYESINEAYDVQEDDDSGVMVQPRNGNVEEMQTDANTYGERIELAEAIDKLMFVVYSVVFAVMLALHF